MEFLFWFDPKPRLVADFEGGGVASDAGLLPVREFDWRVGFTVSLAEAFRDPRTGKTQSRALAQISTARRIDRAVRAPPRQGFEETAWLTSACP